MGTGTISKGSLMGLSINTATPFLLHFAVCCPPFIGTQGQYSSSPKQCAQDLSRLHLVVQTSRSPPRQPSDFSECTRASLCAHSPTSSRAAMPPLCPFALSFPRSCTTPQYLPVRALAPPSKLVCVVRQPIFQARRSRMQNYGRVFVHNPGSIGARE
jgi:hypothetical protein